MPTTPSASPTSVAIDGAGFFAVEHAGRLSFTRLGDFHFDPNGRLVDDEGRAVLGYRPQRHGRPEPIAAKPAKKPSIDAKGVITVDGERGRIEVGRIALAVFPAPERLLRESMTTVVESAVSGAPTFLPPGSANVGALRDHMLENGSVDVEADLERLWLAQQRGESLAAAASAADSCERDALGLVH